MVREESTQADGKAKGPLVSFSLVSHQRAREKKTTSPGKKWILPSGPPAIGGERKRDSEGEGLVDVVCG